MLNKCNPESVLTQLCRAYVDRRNNGMNKQQAREFSRAYLSTTVPFAEYDDEDLHSALLLLSQRKVIYYTLDGNCDLSESSALLLDERLNIK